MTYQKSWGEVKAELREKFIALDAYIKKIFKVNNPSFYMRKSEGKRTS